MEGVRVVAIRNPFDPLTSREIRDFEPGRSIGELIAEFYPEGSGHYEIEVALDGMRLVDDCKMDLIPRNGASVVFCAVPGKQGGKNPLAIISMLALLVVAPYAAAGIQMGLYGAGMISLSTALAIMSPLTVGVAIAGGLVISSVFMPSIPDVQGAGNFQNSPTYAWEPGGNNILEGGVLPELFGTHRIVPPIIGKYIETVGDKQYLNLLFAVAGHAVDSISDVRINETSIANFTGVNVETRLGAVTQPVIPYFADTRTDVAVGAKLNESSWILRTTNGNAVEGIGVTIGLPKGLFYANDAGGMDAQTVKVYIEYSVHNADSWTRLKSYNTTPTSITTGRWSAGSWYYDDMTGINNWIEVLEGSANPSDHTEGEEYIVEQWIDPYWEGGYQSGHYNRLVYHWRWVASETVQAIGTVLNDYIEITAGQTIPIHRVFYKDGLAAEQYDIRCKLVEALPTGSRYGNDTYFESFQEIIYDDFTYPGVSLLAVRALATDRLSGSMPRIDCLTTRLTVPVWTGAAYALRPASNPAWGCYHILHRAVYKGTGDLTAASSYEVFGIPASRIVYIDFLSWAGFCDDPAGDATLQPHTCNIYLDSVFSVRRALDMIGLCGRGAVVQHGSKFTVIVDRPEVLPIQRFLLTPGNIAKDSFTEEWLPMQDRANAVEATYFDAELDNSRQTVEIYATDFDTTEREINKQQVTLYGITARQKAIDYATYLLNSNRYLTLTASLEADVDAIACIPGDIIEVGHDVPQWGYGGRVVSSTNDTVTLDREVIIESGKTYHVMVKHQDDDSREEKTVTTGVGTYTTLSISGTWGKNPALHALYSFGEVGHIVKALRVLRISRSQELRHKIIGIEYVQEVFEDGSTIPEPELVSDLPQISNLTAAEVYRGGAETNIYLSWRGFALFWKVYLKRTGSQWELLGEAYKPSFEIGKLDYGVTYTFAVTGTDDPSEGDTISITPMGKINPPGDVEMLTATKLEFSMLVEWSAVTDFDLWGYELRVGAGSETEWSACELLFKGNARSYVWTYKEIGTYTLHVRAVDAFGNYSVTSKTLAVEVGGPDQADISYSFSGPNVVLTWDNVASDFAIAYYEIRYGWTYASAEVKGTTKATIFSLFVPGGGTRRYWITGYDVAGNEGNPGFADVVVISPGAVGAISPRVIDNNVLLQWTAPITGSLPIAFYGVSRGDVYESSEDIGIVQGTFTVVFEQNAGSYTYWIVPYDTGGNGGTPAGIPATVNQPPDYVILQDWGSAFGGTKVAALLDSGALYAPVNITETYQEHFTSHSYASPQEQVDAGFTAWIMPVPTSGSYTEIFDYGTLIEQQTKINLEITALQEWGTVTISPTIEVSTDGSSWGAPVSGYNTLESGFRYVRVILTFSGTGGNDIVKISSLRLKLDLKQITDAGLVEVTSNGIQVDFNKSFVDITAINLTAKGTTSLFAIYDFTDVPNPTHFHVYLFDAAGADASGAGKYVSWVARGV